MPFISRRARLNLTEEDTIWLERLAQSRTESAARVQRAQIVLRYAQGQTVSAIAAAFNTNRPKVERSVSKALELVSVQPCAICPDAAGGVRSWKKTRPG